MREYFNAMVMCDFYKVAHKAQYPKGTEYVYSTWIPRKSRVVGIDSVVVFGIQQFISEWLIDFFYDNFFNVPLENIVADYKRTLTHTLGLTDVDTTHIEELHALGYLPLRIRSLDEGTDCPIGIPNADMVNTDPRFYWLTNYLETLFSSEVWHPTSVATVAKRLRKLGKFYSDLTCDNDAHLGFQFHDFSMRGHTSVTSSIKSGMGHLLSFDGTDTIPAITALEVYYDADITKELVGASIPASEHSVQCSFQNNDLAYLDRMLEVYPEGLFSIVSDGYDFWKMLTKVIPQRREEILARAGKMVVRPDSGDPVKIVCGDPDADASEVKKGAIEVLWDIFGGTVNSKGYKVLHPSVGLIYGDAITYERAAQIFTTLEQKGFAASNVVFGVGSWTYHGSLTRDTFGFAIKASSITVNGESIAIFKDPKTDDGTKKSLKGAAVVYEKDGKLKVEDGLTIEGSMFASNHLRTRFIDGVAMGLTSLSDIRKKVRG